MPRVRCALIVDEQPSQGTATLHFELGDVFRDAWGFFPEFQGDNDFFESANGDFVGDPAGRVLHGAVKDREFQIVFGSEHGQLWHIWRMRSSASSPP